MKILDRGTQSLIAFQRLTTRLTPFWQWWTLFSKLSQKPLPFGLWGIMISVKIISELVTLLNINWWHPIGKFQVSRVFHITFHSDLPQMRPYLNFYIQARTAKFCVLHRQFVCESFLSTQFFTLSETQILMGLVIHAVSFPGCRRNWKMQPIMDNSNWIRYVIYCFSVVSTLLATCRLHMMSVPPAHYGGFLTCHLFLKLYFL